MEDFFDRQRWSKKCTKLWKYISELEIECSLYKHDRYSAMQYAQGEETAKAEVRVLKDQLTKTSEVLQSYKNQCQKLKEDIFPIRSSTLEEQLLHSVLDSIFKNDGGVANARAFLEDHCDVESCQRLLIMWERLRPSSQNVIALAAEVQTLKNDKEHLISKLNRAEEEFKLANETQLTKMLKELQSYKRQCQTLEDNETKSIDQLMKMAEDVQFYKKQCKTLKGNETKCNDQLTKISEELQVYKNQCQTLKEDIFPIRSSTLEEQLLHSVLDSIFKNDGGVANARAFLEDHCDVESCQRLLIMWERLRPSSQNVIALAAEVQTLKNDKEHLISKLNRAEEEFKLANETQLTKMLKELQSYKRQCQTLEDNETKSDDKLNKLAEVCWFYKNQLQTLKDNETKSIDQLMQMAEDVQFYKNQCKTLKGNETKCNDQLTKMSEELQFYKNQCQTAKEDLSPIGSSTLEDQLLHLVLDSIFGNDGGEVNARAFLEDHCDVESCQRLLIMWERLRPSSQNVIALAAEVQTLKDDKEHLISNLTRAEEEIINILFEENTITDEVKKRLLKLYNREEHHHGSGGKHCCSSSAKSLKRKSSPRECSSVEGMMDLDSGSDMSRPPLSTLHYNTPDSRMHKKQG